MIIFLKNNVDKVWTIISTLIGALISYYVTEASEKHKEKREFQYKKLNDILIPYCNSIDMTKKAINSFDNSDEASYANLFVQLKNPLDFLKAEKRIFLSKNNGPYCPNMM